MILFVNTIWKKAYLWLFDNKKNLLSETFFEIKWNESSLLLPKLEEFVLVNWPGSFTWVRTAVLTINTINFITKKNITPLSYFDLFKSFPIIKSSSKRDSFFQKDNFSEIEIWENQKIKEFLEEKNISKINWDAEIEKIEILENIDYCDIIKNIEFKDFKQVEALYIKKPNIS